MIKVISASVTIKIMRVKIMTIKIMQVNIMTIRIISRQRSAPGSVPPPDPPTLKVPLIRSDQNNTIQIRSDENYKIQIPMKNICCFFHLWRQIILTSHWPHIDLISISILTSYWPHTDLTLTSECERVRGGGEDSQRKPPDSNRLKDQWWDFLVWFCSFLFGLKDTFSNVFDVAHMIMTRYMACEIGVLQKVTDRGKV